MRFKQFTETLFREYKLITCSMVLLFLSVAVISMGRPILIGTFFQNGYKTDSIIVYAYLLLIINACFILFSWLRHRVHVRFEVKTLFQLQLNIINKLLRLPVSFFDRYSMGDLIQRVLILSSLKSLLSSHQLGVLCSFLGLLASFALMFYVSWQLTLLVFGLILFLTCIAIGSALRLLPHLEQHVNDMNHAYGFLLQVIQGISRIKLLARQQEVAAYWYKTYVRSRQQLQSTYNKGVLGYALFHSAPTLLLVIIFFLSRSFELSHFIIFFGSLCLLMSSMSVFYFVIGGMMLDALIAYRRIQPLLEAPDENAFLTNESAQIIDTVERIDFRDVHFCYPHSKRAILCGLNAQIDKGQHVAFVGLSGCGKSTLLKLLSGFYLPQQGQVELNGVALTQIDVQAFRSQMGVVLQDEVLHHGTLLEQIIGYSMADEEDVWSVLHYLGIADFISTLPMGLNTVVSSSQNLLSGGQKQLVLIARALVSKPQIVILDEATNSLDNVLQEYIMQRINHLTMTRITIAHRLSTVRRVDKIFVLNNGVIEQSGSYQQLIEQNGLFYQLAKSQGLAELI